MNRKRIIGQWWAVALMVAAVITYVISALVGTGRSDVTSAAREMSRKVEARMNLLDAYIGQALEGDSMAWMDLQGLPEDMVVYRYVDDSLQSWANQFPLRNDDIHLRTLVQRLGDTRSSLSSPLGDASTLPTFVNYGSKWYLVKAVEEDQSKIVAGLEIVNEISSATQSGVNRHFRVNERYSVRPLSAGVGAPVCVNGEPLFLLTDETLAEPSGSHTALLWLAIGLLFAGLIVMLSVHPTLPWLTGVILCQAAVLVWLYFNGAHLFQNTQLFSPLLYADGPLLYSLGAVVLVNLGINLVVMDLFLVRWTLLKQVRRIHSRALQWVLAGLLCLLFLAIAAYLHLTFRSILINSSINLELYKVFLLNGYTAVVYISFLALSLTLPVLLQMLSPFARALLGIRYDIFTPLGRLLYAICIGIYFVVVSSTLGFSKEQRRIDVWAARLAMDRDIALEIQLRSVENAIAGDPMIGALSVLDGSADIIRSRLASAFMSRISQDYDITVVLPGADVSMGSLFQERVRNGTRLGDNSHFFYNSMGGGRTSYSGLFSYYVENYGSRLVLISVESKHNREDRGYLSLLGISDPGRVSLPSVYSWAKYNTDKLVQYKGSYAFPTVYSGRLRQLAEQHSKGHVELEGWTHFVRNVSDDEVVIISRHQTEWLYYVVEAFLFSILAFGLLTWISWRKRNSGGRRYFQNRISLVVYFSLLVTLVAMAVFSVWFVYKRNNSDMNSVMTARINTLQGMLQEHLRLVENTEQLSTTQNLAAVEGVGNNLRCDITLFDVAGRVVMSTTPEVYDRMILGHRLDNEAFYNIIYAHKRYYMQKERVSRRSYYALYAPVFNSKGDMVAIVSSPFTDLSQDFESEVILHVATVITIFLLLLLISRFITFLMVSRLFRPLTALSRKMTVSDVDHLEPLVYGGDDEITPLVEAYNRMVQVLGESSRRLAQVERDKAWTDMARRVAHDLKNPLTPIKLQLQMLMRMKESGNPAWQDRFDEVASTVLYHVDLLADSADQFSTFAKMYDQKAERIDLDALVRQEVDLFDSRDDVQIEYFGLEGAFVQAPRPQLTRVVVNLITNAIQAVEDIEPPRRLLVSVRNAAEDGFYNIVVEDNGPGVSEQNQDKIFTPDFTTKTSGSGLGLAICKRIVEHCGGTIAYSRSFALGGACFTITIPKA
ncbi:MAG: cache domain-containing protein [Bacteroidales bacterium]|nr:cache domain-containing protein [Bacteroidales bacterium]